MGDKQTLRWLFAIITLLIFILPILLADELSLLASWLLIFVSWVLIVIITGFRTEHHQKTNISKGDK